MLLVHCCCPHYALGCLVLVLCYNFFCVFVSLTFSLRKRGFAAFITFMCVALFVCVLMQSLSLSLSVRACVCVCVCVCGHLLFVEPSFQCAHYNCVCTC